MLLPPIKITRYSIRPRSHNTEQNYLCSTICEDMFPNQNAIQLIIVLTHPAIKRYFSLILTVPYPRPFPQFLNQALLPPTVNCFVFIVCLFIQSKFTMYSTVRFPCASHQKTYLLTYMYLLTYLLTYSLICTQYAWLFACEEFCLPGASMRNYVCCVSSSEEFCYRGVLWRCLLRVQASEELCQSCGMRFLKDSMCLCILEGFGMHNAYASSLRKILIYRPKRFLRSLIYKRFSVGF